MGSSKPTDYAEDINSARPSLDVASSGGRPVRRSRDPGDLGSEPMQQAAAVIEAGGRALREPRSARKAFRI
jgi:hypothetical protein